MVFSKTGQESKNLLCSSLQEDAEMLSSLNFEWVTQIHFHYLNSKKYKTFTCKCWRERNVQHIISWWQVLFIIITNRSCHQDVMASVGKTLQTWNHFNEMGWWLSLTCGMEDCQIYTSHYDLNWNKPKSCRSSNRGLVVNRSLQPVCFWRLGSCRGTFDRR